MRVLYYVAVAMGAVIGALLLVMMRGGAVTANPNSPEAAVNAYLEALTMERYKTAYRHTTEEFQKQISFAEYLYARRTWGAALGIKSYRIVQAEPLNDQARVVVEVRTEQGSVITIPISLIRQDNEWRLEPSLALYQQPDSALRTNIQSGLLP